ncbi:hypothetical protein TRM7557_01803 [Tritonibacter multivorans]|uniref:Uncharacterized protein n=1 Tax=Tritonibacter multivorans TaxID=928856 RepID=A0A0N7LZP9_9RHOB|nr:hypothetical protein [Tritonibacter multivorans]MDA7422857.1 hypothetical protein [Tritonibacter multivorans]CUH78273.1 hypothetical protein TRM7557_01803 [Tritonibacter multivorans]SFD62150.1 hypothetical protein SAMN04488049_11831 [Tritonibacter multivorans]
MTRNDPFELAQMPFAQPGPNPGLLALTLVEEAARSLGPFARLRLALRLLGRLVRAPGGGERPRVKMTAVDNLDAFLRRDIGLPEEAPRRGPPLYPPPPYF